MDTAYFDGTIKQMSLEKCKTCICAECAEKHGTSPMTCEISDCIWCRDDPESTGYRTCSGYIDKGGRYEHG